MNDDTMTDEELAELFDMTVDELISSASGKRGKLFHQTCDGQWIKYETSSTWIFNRDPGDDEP